MLVACVCRKLQTSLLEQDPIVFRWKLSSVFAREKSCPVVDFGLMKSFSELVASISWSTCYTSERFFASAQKYCLKIHDPALKFRLVRELQMHLWGQITWNATWVQVQIPTAWLVMDIRLICRLDFLLALTEKQNKSVDCNGSSLPLFSLPHFLRIVDIIGGSRRCLPNFLNNYIIHQNLVDHVDNQKRFQEYPNSLVYFAAFQFRGWAFLNSRFL